MYHPRLKGTHYEMGKHYGDDYVVATNHFITDEMVKYNSLEWGMKKNTTNSDLRNENKLISVELNQSTLITWRELMKKNMNKTQMQPTHR